MKKHLWMTAAILVAMLSSCATQKVSYEDRTRIAVMDFAPRVGVSESEVVGLSEMLINSLYNTGKFVIVERSQLNKVLKEQKFQQSDLTSEQVVKIGEILGVDAIVIGSVNFIATGRTLYQKEVGTISGEYNIDVRVVDCTTGELITTAGATRTRNNTYRDLMEKIGKELGKKMIIEKESVEQPLKEKKQKIQINSDQLIKDGISSLGILLVFLIGCGLIV